MNTNARDGQPHCLLCSITYYPDREQAQLTAGALEFLGYPAKTWLQPGFLQSIIATGHQPLWQQLVNHFSWHDITLNCQAQGGEKVCVRVIRRSQIGELPLRLDLQRCESTPLSPAVAQLLRRRNLGYLYLNDQGSILAADIGLAARLGYTPEQLGQLQISQLEGVRGGFAQLIQSALPVPYMNRLLTQSGDPYLFNADLVKLSPLNNYLLVEFPTEAGRTSEHFLDISGVIMLALDESGRISRINRFACDLLEVSAQEAIGLNWFTHFLPDDSIQKAQQAYRCLMEGQYAPNPHIEKTIQSRSGKGYLIRWHNQVIENEQGERCGLLACGVDITAQDTMNEQLLLVKAMVDHSADPLICTDPKRRFLIIYANQAALKHFGVDAETLYASHLYEWDPDYPAARLVKTWQQIQQAPLTLETCHRLRDGSEVPIEAASRAFHYYDNAYMITVFKDLRDRIHYQTAVKTAQDRSQLLLEHSNEGIFGMDVNGLTTFINPAAAMMLGYSPEELVGRNNHYLIHHSNAQGYHVPAEECKMLLAMQNNKSYRVDEDVLWRKDGSCFPVEYWSSPILEQDKVVGAVITFHDITHRKMSEEKIRYLAFHDSLTGLPNRRLFMDRFEHELSQERRSGLVSALHILDLDHFKEINDTLGHPAGDQLLVEVAQRILDLLRDGDTFARLGGDEFAILQSNVNDLGDVASLAAKVISSFERYFAVEGSQLRTNTSIGIVLCDPQFSADELISKADVALYRAKEQGRGCFVFYQQEMTLRVQREAELTHMLSSAGFLQQLYLEYQPQYHCQSGQWVGMEALLRWQHPEQGLISPMSFIPVAEKRGMIDEIGLWVVQQVCQDASQWLADGLEFGRVSFNLSPVQLRSEQGIIRLLETLYSCAMPLSLFEVEVTESAYMDAEE